MKKSTVNSSTSGTKHNHKPAYTIEEKEDELIAAAVELAEQQIRDGTASSQIITHYLKLGTTRERLEKEKLKADIALANAKVETLQSAKEMKEMYEAAMKAMTRYTGGASNNE